LAKKDNGTLKSGNWNPELESRIRNLESTNQRKIHKNYSNGPQLLKDAKRLPETHSDSLLLLCYSLDFSEQFDLGENLALNRARLNKRWVT